MILKYKEGDILWYDNKRYMITITSVSQREYYYTYFDTQGVQPRTESSLQHIEHKIFDDTKLKFALTTILKQL